MLVSPSQNYAAAVLVSVPDMPGGKTRLLGSVTGLVAIAVLRAGCLGRHGRTPSEPVLVGVV